MPAALAPAARACFRDRGPIRLAAREKRTQTPAGPHDPRDGGAARPAVGGGSHHRGHGRHAARDARRAHDVHLGNGVQVLPLAGGGAIVSLHGSVNSGDRSVGAGCQQVGNANAGAMPSDFPGGRSAAFVATCDLTNVRIVEEPLGSASPGGQGWLSTINLPTNVTTTSNSGPLAGQGAADKIFTGDAGTASPGATRGTPLTRRRAVQGPGGIPPERQRRGRRPEPQHRERRRRQRHLPPRPRKGTRCRDRRHRDRPRHLRGPVHDRRARVCRRSPDARRPGERRDPNIDQLDSTALGEGDNIGTDVEDLTGTKREDRLIGNGLQNVLFGDEGVDTLTGGTGEDTAHRARAAVAGSGTADVSVAAPRPR